MMNLYTQIRRFKNPINIRFRFYHTTLLPRHWNTFNTPLKYRIFRFVSLSTTLSGTLLAHYLESIEKQHIARDVLSADIHIISCIIAFNAGITSGLENALNSGIAPRNLHWKSHIKQMGGLSIILLTSFASGLSYNAPRDSLYLLLAASCFTLLNDLALNRSNLPLWFFGYKKKFIAGLAASALGLLTCESQQLKGRAIQIDK